MTAIRVSIFDVTEDMLPPRVVTPPTPLAQRRRLAKARPDVDPSTPNIELRLVRGYIRASAPRRDSYGVPFDRRAQRCARCGIRFSSTNPNQGGDSCRDCCDVEELIDGGAR